jgi:hypothetical protein
MAASFFCFTTKTYRRLFSITIKLQSETHGFATQNAGFCSPICSILLGKMQGFAQQRHF